MGMSEQKAEGGGWQQHPSAAGDPDWHTGARGWLPCLSPVPVAAGGRWLRPRVFSAHMPAPQLQVHAPAWAVSAHGPSPGRAPLDRRPATGVSRLRQVGFLHVLHAHFYFLQSGQTGAPAPAPAPAQTWAADRPSGKRYTGCIHVASVDHTALLRRSARCSLRDHTARAHAATAVLSDHIRFFMCRLVICGLSAGHSRKKMASLIPAESHVAGCMPAARKEAI
jgi:hypothetical protein